MVSQPRIIKPEIVDELLKDYQNPEDLLGEGGILKQFTKILVESYLSTELVDYLEESPPWETRPIRLVLRLTFIYNITARFS